MQLKSFIVPALLVAGSLSSKAQKVQNTTETDLHYLFLVAIEEGLLPTTAFSCDSVAGDVYDCRSYDFIVPPDTISLRYCPDYPGQVDVVYPQGDEKESKRAAEKRKNVIRTGVYNEIQSYTMPLDDD